MENLVIMSKKELHRLEIIQKLAEKRLLQIEAATQLHISTRQIRRLMRLYEVYGPAGLTTKLREVSQAIEGYQMIIRNWQ